MFPSCYKRLFEVKKIIFEHFSRCAGMEDFLSGTPYFYACLCRIQGIVLCGIQTSLDVSGRTALTELNCYQNQLTGLNVNGCTALIGLHCDGNQLKRLDLDSCTALTKLDCFENQLLVLDLDSCTELSPSSVAMFSQNSYVIVDDSNHVRLPDFPLLNPARGGGEVDP